MIAQTRLAQIFAETAVESMQAFPHELRGLYVSEVQGNMPGTKAQGYKQGIAFVSPAAIEAQHANPDEVAKILSQAHEEVYNKNFFGIATTNSVYDFEIRTMRAFNLVCVRANFSPIERPYTTMPMPIEMDVVGIIDHEFGHLLVRLPHCGLMTQHLRECAAEAYAAIRHVQRYGWNTGFFTHAPFTRARTLAHGLSEDHYTAAIIQQVATLQHTMDVQALDQPQTAQLAARLATRYFLSTETISRLKTAFLPLADWLDAGTADFSEKLLVKPATHRGYFETLFEIIRKNETDHDVFRLGNLIVGKHRKELEAEPYWEKALDDMAAQQRKYKIEPNLAKAIDAARGQPFLHVIRTP